MMRSRVQGFLAGVVLGTSAIAVISLGSVPARAETLEELDALSDLTADEATGIAAARDQATRGQLLDALATLERVLAVFPTSQNALLMHALYLCQIDDRQGGLVEIGKLKEKKFGAQVLSDARAQCQRGGGA
ncbi:hypothetical protein GCM10009127_13260 [Alteraurantiacibacter aestuarii]|uniref:Tetratricopeptide repeat protein n=1 Tax=Alteraurantiacibacter aestuarii TaxID=650004 RepID=A0A844ZKJ8_9SPHN|nr:hypothetical protein [Alteraurantiacibacter aestuarii]MXO88084.1 hypothetical protein [Alteraurantiacibacter aestuarii]